MFINPQTTLDYARTSTEDEAGDEGGNEADASSTATGSEAAPKTVRTDFSD